MAILQLIRNPFAKNAVEEHSFFNKPAGRRIRPIQPSPVPLQASRWACPAETAELRRVQVAGVLDLPIVQQPPGNDGYVSRTDGQITQFRTPSKFGNVGLLAHNDLSGRFFSGLTLGQDVQLVYGNDRIETFVVTDILRYRALQPDDLYSLFYDLRTKETLTVNQLFSKAYQGSRHVTFQTCIAAPNNLTWGRLFVIATHKNPSGSHRWN